jgi:hypothetical protein
LRRLLLRRGILFICPHRKGRRSPPSNDTRIRRRYRKHWKVECTIAWLGNYRHLLVRREHHGILYQGFFQLACLLITLRRL